jgi:hypothetical protein
MESLLKINEIRTVGSEEPSVQFGDHLYLDVAFASHWPGVCLYWRLVDPKFSLLEVGLDSVSGQLRSLTVPLYNGELDSQSDAVKYGAAGLPLGIPIFDTTSWTSDLRETKHRFIDVRGRIRLRVCPTEMMVIISEEPIHQSIQVNSRVVCELNASAELVGFRILGISPEERERLASESKHARGSMGRVVGS